MLTTQLTFKIRFSQCIDAMTNVHYIYIFTIGDKTMSYIRNKCSTFQIQIKNMIHYLFNYYIVLSFIVKIYCPWVLIFIDIGFHLMVLPRILRRHDPSYSVCKCQCSTSVILIYKLTSVNQ